MSTIMSWHYNNSFELALAVPSALSFVVWPPMKAVHVKILTGKLGAPKSWTSLDLKRTLGPDLDRIAFELTRTDLGYNWDWDYKLETVTYGPTRKHMNWIRLSRVLFCHYFHACLLPTTLQNQKLITHSTLLVKVVKKKN